MRIRLREFRKRLGLTLDEMAERAGFSTSQLSRWEAGSSNIPSERLPDLAKAYECRVGDIFTDDDSPFVPLGPTLYVRGPVAAGQWYEVWEEPEDEWKSFTGRADVTAPLRDRFGVRVEGESMNEAYPHGTILECVSFLGGAEIASGKRVIVERTRVDGEREVTVKELHRDENGIEWLVPRSSNPAFQSPIRADEQEDGIVQVRVIGVVVGSYRPE
jgi:transcriptional regulator with XRE-family HTH domain